MDVSTAEPFAKINITSATYVRPFNDAEIILSAIILITFMVFGVLANTLTIAVIVSYRTLNDSVFMRFILSLCVSDLLSALISWLFLYRRTWGFDVWSLPPFLCKFYWGADLMTSYVTALHIFSFAILRYVSIRFPHFYHKIKIRHGNAWIVCIWIVCLVCGFIPYVIIFGARPKNRLSNDRDSVWPACTVLLEKLPDYSAYQNWAYPVFLLVPAVGVLMFCLLTVLNVHKRSAQHREQQAASRTDKRMRKEKQAVVQLVLIIVSFMIGYIPFLAYEYWAVNHSGDTLKHRKTDYWFGVVEYYFLRFSECLNPVFYNLGSAKMRDHTKTFLRKKLCCCLRWKKKKVTAQGKTTRSRRSRTSASSDGLKTSGTNFGV